MIACSNAAKKAGAYKLARLFSSIAMASAVLFCCSNRSLAARITINPKSDIDEIVERIRPGDHIVFQDGTWRDVSLKFSELQGTKQQPIHLLAETEGKVIFTGSSTLRISGQHIVISGLVFRNTDRKSDVLELRTHSKRHAHQCRVSNCVFEQTDDFRNKSDSRWLSIYGSKNRVDHCYFAGKKNKGTVLVVWLAKRPGQHQIDHNHFGPRPKLGKNGGEIIRIGTSEVSENVSQTTVENNYFHRCDGEAEIVSNKSCENVYRHNVFDECSGALTLRHGHRCVVDANVFLGKKQSGTGGIRIIGAGHQVTNNYFEGLRGDAERAAVSMMNGIPDGPLDMYAPVQNALVAHNTFIDCKVAMEIGVGASKKQTASPESCDIKNNLFDSGKWAIFRVHASPVSFTWSGNKSTKRKRRTISEKLEQEIGFKTVEADWQNSALSIKRIVESKLLRCKKLGGVTKDIDGHTRSDSTLAGCDDPATSHFVFPNASHGPTWKK